MKCQRMGCDNEAHLPMLCCSSQHGYEYKEIIKSLEGGFDNWGAGIGGPYKITPEQEQYYSQFVRDKARKENNGNN